MSGLRFSMVSTIPSTVRNMPSGLRRKMGVRQALSEGSAVLMQPIFRSEIHIPSVYSGSLVQIVSALKGQVLGFDRMKPPRDGTSSGHSFRAAHSTIWHGRCARRRRALVILPRPSITFEELYGKEADAIVRAHETQLRRALKHSRQDAHDRFGTAKRHSLRN